MIVRLNLDFNTAETEKNVFLFYCVRQLISCVSCAFTVPFWNILCYFKREECAYLRICGSENNDDFSRVFDFACSNKHPQYWYIPVYVNAFM